MKKRNKRPLGRRDYWTLLKDTLKAFSADEGQRRGAALSFFSIFSLSPLFVVVLAIASLWFGRAQAQAGVFEELADLIGLKGAEAVQALVASQEPAQSGWAALIALGTLIIGATIVFVELQSSLNVIWKVRHKPGGNLVRLVMARVLSFALILSIGFLLLVSLVLSAALTALTRWMVGFWPSLALVMNAVEFLVSFGVITLLFALIFKILPDVRIAWGDVWTGSVLTALLFTIGKTLIGLYLGRAGVVSSYGAAGSLVVALLWIYYSSQLFFFGAEFTALYANRFGSRLTPAPGSERADLPCANTPEKGLPASAKSR